MSVQFIRQIDDLGRIVIPKDLRNQYGIKPGDRICIEATDNGIIIKTKGGSYERDEQGKQD